MSTLFDDFVQCGGEWHKSVILKSMKRTNRSSRRGVRKWLTKSQMMTLFGDKAIVNSICLRKESDPVLRETEIRDHPDLPGWPLSACVLECV